MRIHKADAQTERQIATAMIMSDTFLRDIQAIYDPELVEVSYIRTIAGWCIEYFEKYEKAPRQDIREIYNSHCRSGLEGAEAELIGDLLTSLAVEFEDTENFNTEYILDRAEAKFKAQSLQHLAEDMKVHLTRGDVVAAETLLTEYNMVTRPTSQGINPFTSEDLAWDLFPLDGEPPPLFTYPGVLGMMLNSQFVREGFIGVMGPEKRGKTWWEMDFAMQAAAARCNVAFFEVGDMSQNQIATRQFIYLAKKSNRKRYCGELSIPTLDCEANQQNKCREHCRTCRTSSDRTGYKPCSVCQKGGPGQFRPTLSYVVRPPVDPLNATEAIKLGRKFGKGLRGRDFKLIAFPNSSITVAGIESQLDQWEDSEGFIPDVIIIDYADILAPENPRQDKREQEDYKWRRLRALSQRRRCLVVTATQADAASYTRETLGMTNFTETKSKYAHVTGMVTLNQTRKERQEGIMRVGQLAVREDDFDASSPITVLQCLQIGRPHLGSFLRRKIEGEEEKAQ